MLETGIHVLLSIPTRVKPTHARLQREWMEIFCLQDYASTLPVMYARTHKPPLSPSPFSHRHARGRTHAHCRELFLRSLTFSLIQRCDDVLFTRARVPVIIVRTHEQLKITYTRTIDSGVSLKMHHCLKRSLRSIKLV